MKKKQNRKILKMQKLKCAGHILRADIERNIKENLLKSVSKLAEEQAAQ